ncbi:MAG: methyltransferase [Chlorobi bacterium]|nr:methyltransferase [Chlorobiota bacterium]
MTSRERVLTTLNHKEPDKIPIDFGGMRSTSIMAIAYNRLKKELGFNNSVTRMLDITQQLAIPEKEILDIFQVDVISLEDSYLQNDQEWKEWQLPDNSKVEIPLKLMPKWNGEEWVLMDGERVKARMPESCLYFENSNPPLENAVTEQDIQNYNWQIYSDEYLRVLENKAKQLYEETDYAIMGGFGGNIIENYQVLRGYSNAMLDLVADPNFAEALIGKMTEVHLINLEKYLQAVSKYIQVIQMGDDLGMQSGPQISLDLYQAFIKPAHKKIYKYVKSNSDLFLFLHSCGSIYDFIPDLIDAGVDILNPVQFSASRMDSSQLKREFRDKITFWGGGVDTQNVLPFGTPEEVEKQVKEQIEKFAPGGGFVFAAVHNIQANIPTENIIKLFETAIKYRNY